MAPFKESLMYSNSRMPLVIEPASQREPLHDLLSRTLGLLHEKLLGHGAILFRGFRTENVADFAQFSETLSSDRMNYLYRSTPRTSVGDRIFTATEYPAQQEIPLHNENAYQREWPMMLAFCCLVPATEGGETPIADMGKVIADVPELIVDKFETLGVKYVRHYHPYADLPWQVVFQTNDPREIQRFCEVNGILHTWLDDETLRTEQICQGTAIHPVTRARVFFNQAHLFHVSSLGSDEASEMIELFGKDRLPRHAYFGNGADIPEDFLKAVNAAFRNNSISFRWQAGDVLLIDNMQAAHGRKPYRGNRQVLAALFNRMRSIQ